MYQEILQSHLLPFSLLAFLFVCDYLSHDQYFFFLNMKKIFLVYSEGEFPHNSKSQNKKHNISVTLLVQTYQIHIMSLFLWYTFLLWEKLLEDNGEKNEKSRMPDSVLWSCLERGERFGWLVTLEFFKELFAQMKQHIKAQSECIAAWLNVGCLLQNTENSPEAALWFCSLCWDIGKLLFTCEGWYWRIYCYFHSKDDTEKSNSVSSSPPSSTSSKILSLPLSLSLAILNILLTERGLRWGTWLR